MAIRIKSSPGATGRANSDPALHGYNARLHVASDIRKTLHRVPRIAVRSALPGKCSARYPRSNPRVPSAKVSAIRPQSSVRTSCDGSRSQHPTKADTAGSSPSHATTMGSAASGGIARITLAENVRAVPRAELRSKCTANCRKIQYHPAMVSARGLQSRYAQTSEMRRMSFRRAEKPGNV